MARKPKICYFQKEIPDRISYTSVLETPIGRLRIVANTKELISVLFLVDNCEVEICENEITKKAKQELKEYFAGERKEFSHFRMQLPGFEGRVLRAVKKIPYGTTINYKELAELANMPYLVEMAADALEENFYLIMIPSHRIVGSDQKLHRYQAGLERKKYLLELEAKYSTEEEKKRSCMKVSKK